MVKLDVRRKKEAGQAVLLVVASMSIFLLGAVGLAVDGSHLYAQRQAAQAAADASAVAGIMSIFDGTGSGWDSSAYTCTKTDTTTPCVYARTNGFGKTSGTGADTVYVEPDPSGVTVSNLDAGTPNLLRVTVTRPVSMTLTKFVGLSSFNVKAQAMAAIVDVTSPVPMIITDPIGANALSMNGTTQIKICGGPTQSIQINSSSPSAFTGGGTVDLRKAGPLDTTGNCTAGTGANFGVFGGDSTNPGSVLLGIGHYVSPSSPIQDPLAGVPPPSVPTTSGTTTSVAQGTYGCTVSGGCILFSPGLWTGGISVPHPHDTLIFMPGVYYINGGGFDLKNTTASMCPVPASCSSDPVTGSGMVIYDTGPKSKSGCDSTGGFTIDTGVTASFLGADLSTASPPAAPTSPYYGILFFEDRNACAQTHTLGQGNGCFDLIGTIYITNTLALMKAGTDQTVDYHGTPCSSTANQGEIIVSDLSMQGNSQINMGLYPTGFLKVRQVALVQ